jgi:hypothetical protein
MRDAALELPFVLERWVMRPEFVEDLEFQFLELVEKLEPPAVPAPEMVPGATLPRLESMPSESAPSNAVPAPVSPDGTHETPPGLRSEVSPELPPEASPPVSVEPNLSTREARRTFLDEFKAECKRLARSKVTMGDLALIAGYTTRNRRFAMYEWLRQGDKGNVYSMLMAGSAKAAEALKSPKNERIRAMTRSATAPPEV